MTNLVPDPNWSDVRQLEANEYATGGAGGNMNEQALALTARTGYLDKYTASPYRTGKVYDLNERVQLESGDIVKNTIANNTANPNTDMTGWENISKQAIKFLSAKSLGLVTWPEFKKPPYTPSEYTQANNNGVILSEAIKKASLDGFSEIVIEQANYPFLYKNLTGTTDFNYTILHGSIELDSIKNIEINFNGSMLFILYDSNNKHQYNLTTSQEAYKLTGSLCSITNSRNVIFKNGYLQGDQYCRAWVAGEELVEQTHGIKAGKNNRNIESINMKYTGFRADGLSGAPRGNQLFPLTTLDTWSKGGLNDSNGADIVEVGSYKSVRIDLNSATDAIIDNRLQIWNYGDIKAASFRNPSIKAFFYDSANTFILMYTTGQAEDILIPKNAAYLQFVATDDERTTDTVTYSAGGNLVLGTGMSSDFYVSQCEFFENMRGGISNLANNTTIEDTVFRDSGRLSKLGFKAYSDATQYAVNFEDTYLTSLNIDNCKALRTPFGFLGNCREFFVNNNTMIGQYYSPVSDYSCVDARITNNHIESSRETAIAHVRYALDQGVGNLTIDNNMLINSYLSINISNEVPQALNVINNNGKNAAINIIGNGSNANVANNSIRVGNKRTTPLELIGTIGGNNTFIVDEKEANQRFFTLESGTSRNSLLLYSQEKRITPPLQNTIRKIIKTNFISDGKTLDLRFNNANTAWSGHVDKFSIVDCGFDKLVLTPNFVAASATSYDSEIVIESSEFKNGSYIRLSKRDASATANKLVIKSVVFDLTDATTVVQSLYPILGSYAIEFVNCTFVASTAKSLAFLSGDAANKVNITSKLVGCRLINVTNTDGITTVVS